MKHLTTASLSKNGIHVDERGGVTIPAKFGSDYRLCRIEGSATEFKMRYLKDRWNYLNDRLFGGALKEPNFKISKAKRTLGVWRAHIRELELGIRLFLLREDSETLNTLVHEMCHQYVSEVLHAYGVDMGPTGHGPAWQRVMHAVGLPVDEAFVGSQDIITKKVVLDKRDEQRELIKKHQERNPLDIESGDGYTLVRYINPNANVDCPAIILSTKALIVTVPGLLIDKQGALHKAVPLNQKYCVTPGPLKIKTPLYRKAQEYLDGIRVGDFPLTLPSPRKY